MSNLESNISILISRMKKNDSLTRFSVTYEYDNNANHLHQSKQLLPHMPIVQPISLPDETQLLAIQKSVSQELDQIELPQTIHKSHRGQPYQGQQSV